MVSNRLLKIIFIFLLMVIFGEVAYYLYVHKEKSNEFQYRLKPSQTQDRLISSQTIEYLKNDILPSLEKIPKSDPGKYYLIHEINGYVGEFKFDSRLNGYILKITSENGNNLISYFISKKNIEKKKFLKMFQGTKIPISYKDIKAGQKITVINKDDLVNPSSSYDEYLFY